MKISLVRFVAIALLVLPQFAFANDFPKLNNKKDFIDVFFAVLNGKKEVEVAGKTYGIEYTKGSSSKDVQKKMNMAFASIGGTVDYSQYTRESFEALLQTVHNVLTGNTGMWDLYTMYSIMYNTEVSEADKKELKGKQKGIWDIVFGKRDEMPEEAKKSFLELTSFKKFSFLHHFDSEKNRQGYRVKIFNASDKVMAFEDIEIYLTHKDHKKDHKKNDDDDDSGDGKDEKKDKKKKK